MKNWLKYQKQKIHQYLTIFPFIKKKTEQIQFKLLTPTGTKIAKVGDKIQFPKNKYINLQAYLQGFYNSTSQNGRVNGQHITFIVGAENSGKTSLIKQSIKIYKNRKISFPFTKQQQKSQILYTTLSTPQYLQDLQRKIRLENQYSIVLQFDFSSNFMMKSQAFFHHIQSQIISKILKISEQIKNKTNITVIDPNVIKDIVIAQNSIQYVYINLKDTIYAILNNTDRIRFNENSLQKLQAINQRILQADCFQFFGKNRNIIQTNNSKVQLSLFEQVVELIATDKKISQNQASLSLFLSIFKRVQYQNRPSTHNYYSYQTGIQSTQYLFSIINYLCGFGNLNKQTLSFHINQQQNPYQKYYIGKGNHIDVIMTFSHMQKLYCYKNNKFVQWFDNLLIRAHNSTNLRTHFPIVIQLSDWEELWELQKCGRMELDNPTVMEIPGYFKTNIFRYNPQMVMNKPTVQRLRPVLGRNPSTWNEAMLQLSKGTPIEDIMSYRAPFMNKRKFVFQNKINRLYISPQVLPYLDKNTLKYQILHFLTILYKCKGNLRTYYIHHTNHMFEHPVFKQLYKNKLIHRFFYLSAISLSDMRDLHHIGQYIKNLKLIQKIKYKLWRQFGSPYRYFILQLKYRDLWQIEQRKRLGPQSLRSDFMLRQYYGQLQDYRITLYESVYKQKYNL